MGRLEHFEILFDRPDATYLAGQLITGRVSFVLRDQLVIEQVFLHAKGEGYSNWMNDTSERTFSSKQIYLNQTVNLHGTAMVTCILPHGRHEFQFSFQLPLNLPSSIENEYGYIRYSCIAVVKRKKEIGCVLSYDYIREARFTVIAKVDMMRMVQNGPQPLQAYGEENMSTLLCCKKSQTIGIGLMMIKSGYNITEAITCRVQIANHSQKQIKATIRLLQYLRFHGYSQFLEAEETKVVCNQLASKSLGPIAPRCCQAWDEELIEVPSSALPTQSGFMVDVDYKMVLETEPTTSKVELPIIIGN